ncbi:hypothetical protein Q664_25665 [Archangium violaceum Cb vi76]|uniref:Uncharacterized protein n=1 Tax=Archangium violaceum Cb vi76 TaxID=1406225 RepID=A0A084SQX7_9BACT|nr:hypothetical protein Q664_25665 [Archangium violaceum Cb vi76]
MDEDVVCEIGELLLERFQLGAAIWAALNEDVSIEARLSLQCESSRAIEKLLGRRRCEIGEQQS